MDTAGPTALPAPASNGTVERDALEKVMWFGIIELAGLVCGWIGTSLFVGDALGNLTPANLGQNPTPARISAALGPIFANISLLLPIVAIIQIAAVIVLIVAFRQLKGIDGSFSIPSTLSIVLLIGSVLTTAGGAPLFSQLPNLIAQVPTTTGTTLPTGFVTTLASVVVYFFLIAIGGILATIGLIGGEVLGLWRVGSKYNETLLKLGAIFGIIPLLNIVAPVLVIVGARQAKKAIPVQM